MHPYIIMAIVAGVLLIIFWRGRNAVWGGATVGVIVGLILALVKNNWLLMALCFTIGTYIGLFAEGLGRLSDRLRYGQRR